MPIRGLDMAKQSALEALPPGLALFGHVLLAAGVKVVLIVGQLLYLHPAVPLHYAAPAGCDSCALGNR